MCCQSTSSIATTRHVLEQCYGYQTVDEMKRQKKVDTLTVTMLGIVFIVTSIQIHFQIVIATVNC